MFRDRRQHANATPSPSRASPSSATFTLLHSDKIDELPEVISEAGDAPGLVGDEDSRLEEEKEESEDSDDDDDDDEDGKLTSVRASDGKAEGIEDEERDNSDELRREDIQGEHETEEVRTSSADRSSISRTGGGASAVFASALGKINVLWKQHRPSSTKSRAFARVIVKNKKTQELNNMRCAQRLAPHAGPVWVLEWSPAPSTYLATAGKDGKIVVWELGTDSPSCIAGDSPPFRPVHHSPRNSTVSRSTTTATAAAQQEQQHSSSEVSKQQYHSKLGFTVRSGGGQGEPPKAEAGGGSHSAAEHAETVGGVAVTGTPVFKKKPYRVYIGHVGDVTALSWSKSLFLASGSVDKTCRLWHISADSCLAVLRHPDFVTGLDFHPLDDSLLLTGCFDAKLRFWDIPNGIVQQRITCASRVTACKFNQSGEMAVAGLYTGHLVFYQMAPFGYGKPVTSEMRYYTQIETRNKTGTEKKGRKVTGIRFVSVPERTGAFSRVQDYMLVTTNEAKSRSRLYSMDDFSLVCRYKGSTNVSMLQIGSRCSEDGRHIICGSEDKGVYVWRLKNDLVKTIFGGQGRKAFCETYESFHASLTGPISVACFAPDHVVRAYSRGKHGSKGGGNSGQVGHESNSEATSAGDDDQRLNVDMSSQGGDDNQSASSAPPSSALAGAEDDVGLAGAIILTAGTDGIVGVFQVGS